jgi:signal recognition particle subunit SRP54
MMPETPDRQSEFTLLDFRKQLAQIGKLGPIRNIISMIPGMNGMTKMLEGQNPEAQIRRQMGIIDSMTPDERCNPSKMANQWRRRRVADGAGVEPHEVKELVEQFGRMAKRMKMSLPQRLWMIYGLGRN